MAGGDPEIGPPDILFQGQKGTEWRYWGAPSDLHPRRDEERSH